MSQSDMVRQQPDTGFGRDFRLIGEAFTTLLKLGAGRQFWATLAHDETMAAKVIAMVMKALRLLVNFGEETGGKILSLWIGPDHTGWSYLGPEATGTVELDVEVINFPGETLENLVAVRARCEALGYELVSGQAAAAFERAFPKPIGEKKLIFFGGSEFRDPDGDSHVAYLRWGGSRWCRGFDWSGDEFYPDCWFAVVRKSGMEVATE